MPFITEELWSQFGDAPASQLMRAPLPTLDPALIDAGAAAEMDWLIRLVSDVRALRAEMNVPPGSRLSLLAKGANAATEQRLKTHSELISRLARLERIEIVLGELPKDAVQLVVDEATFGLPLGGVIDVVAERARLEKEIAKHDGELSKLARKLENPQFLAKAPPEVVAEQEQRRGEALQAREKLEAALARLASF
jgi:valyl-tRNA synthetase